jgi:organic hydroperoxide reductase OsmC/OhrA
MIAIPGKPAIAGSSDPAFRGDASRHNPEELLVASLAACHMLWYLHLCSEHKFIVTSYRDDASGTLQVRADGSGAFTNVTLKPCVILDASHDANDVAKARALHDLAHRHCFIANSVAFAVIVEPTIRCEPQDAGLPQ